MSQSQHFQLQEILLIVKSMVFPITRSTLNNISNKEMKLKICSVNNFSM